MLFFSLPPTPPFSSTPRPEWLPDSAGREDLRGARIYFLCGDDLLESFNVKGLWAQEDVSWFYTTHLFQEKKERESHTTY